MNQPTWHGENVTLHHGDCIPIMAGIPACSVDAIVTDPPYGLGFMGKAWDDLPPGLDWARECVRVLKPGGHLLAFGGTRTWHRLAVAVEDAGFEIRDSIAWLYGSGFPKSMDVSKAIDKAAGVEREVIGKSARHGGGIVGAGSSFEVSPKVPDITAPATDAARQWNGWGTALKPAFEPIVFARKPLAGTVAANVLAHGTGALNIDGCRIGTTDLLGRPYGGDNEVYGKYSMDRGTRTGDELTGRWPANVALDTDQAAALDKQSGSIASTGTPDRPAKATTFSNSQGYGGGIGLVQGPLYSDSGGASRFFYVAKAPTVERPRQGEIAHPTVKPIDLMQWLVRLVTPPGGTVLDPFAGSGTTGEAAIREGFSTILIEREADYLPLIRERFRRPINYVMEFGE